MSVEAKSGTITAVVEEGKALVKLATLLRIDKDNDVLEHQFFPTAPPLVVSIQPYHNHQTPSLGHATVWEDEAKGEVLAQFEFNDSLAAKEQWKVLRWDFEHGAIQEFSWAFRPKPGAARSGTFEGHTVRFLGKASDGSFGVDLLETGPVLRGASINSGTLQVRSEQQLEQLVRKQQHLLREQATLLEAYARESSSEARRERERQADVEELVSQFQIRQRYLDNLRRG